MSDQQSGDGEHLNGELLLLFDSGELAADQQLATERHLAGCSSCRKRLEEYRDTVSDAQINLAAERRLNFTRRLSALETYHRRKRCKRWVRPLVASLTAASVFFAATFIWDNEARASEVNQLLGEALRVSEAASGRPERGAGAIQFRTASTTCPERSAGIPSPRVCDSAVQALRMAKWRVDRPLAVESFAHWRSSLLFKRDTIAAQRSSVTITTVALIGPIRLGSITLDARDYHAASAHLEPVGLPAIDFTERSKSEAEIAPRIPSAVPRSARPPAGPAPVSTDPLAEPEIQVRLILHQLKADRGYEASVVRDGGEIHVHGLFTTESRRKQVSEALSHVSQVRLDFKTLAEAKPGDDAIFAIRETGGTLPRLANAWLKERFPDSSARADFVNRVNGQAGDLLGLAKTRQELEQRYQVFQGVPHREDLRTVIDDEDRSISGLLQDMLGQLEPLSGPLEPPMQAQGSALTFEQARVLESAVARLFLAGHDSDDSLDAELQRVRSLFTSR